MTFPNLYKRTSTGAIQEWQIIVHKDGFHTVEGLVGGKSTTSKKTLTEGKNIGKSNETSPSEQAILEAKAKYDKKLKSGGYFLGINDIDDETFFLPMLAKSFQDYEDKIDWKEGVGVQIKFNGARIIAERDGLFTRKGEKYISIPHIEECLAPFFKQHPGAVLDGEGYNYSLRQKLNEVMSLLRRTVNITSEDLQRSKDLVRFNIYDGFGFGATSEDGYLCRKKYIDAAFKDKYGKGVLDKVETFIVHSKEELDTIYFSFLEDQQEGAIIRILNKPYENKRSKYLLKYKPVDDAEFLVLDVEEGEGNRGGMAGRVIVQMKDGRTFAASMKGEESQFVEVLKNKKKYIGKMATIYYNGLTGKGIPNFARFDCDNWKKE